MPDEIPFMDPDALADYLQIAPATVKFWRYQRKGPPYIRVPGSQQILYRREAVDAWLATGESEPPKRKRGRPKKSTCTVPSRPVSGLDTPTAAR